MNDQVEEIKSRSNVVEVVGQYVELKKMGRHHKGLCPFHSEKTPSFTVNEELGFYKCFGCGAGGDVIKFLMEVEGIDFFSALEKLAQRVGIKLERTKRDNSEVEILYEIMDLAARYYHWLLVTGKSGELARKYLSERKMNGKLIETFNLGFALDSWDGLIKYLHGKKSYKLELLERAGLVVKKAGGGYYDKFRGRLMFPLQDAGGKIVGFTGRVIPGLSKDGEPKYLNSPETEIYHKGKTLYGFFQAKKEIRVKKRVVLVEGQMDMISSFGAGVGETVAVSGTGITENQIEMMARLADKIYISLDADDAGYVALKRTAEMSEKRGVSIKVVQIEGGKDPDEIARNSQLKWREMIDKAVDVYEFVINRAIKKMDGVGPESIKKVIDEVVPFLAKIENTVIREVWSKRLAEKIEVSAASVIEEIGKTRGGKANISKPATVKSEPLKTTKLEKLLRSLIQGVMANFEVRKTVGEWLEDFDLSGSGWKILKTVLEEGAEVKDKELVDLLPAELRDEAREIFTSEDEPDSEPRRIKETAINLMRELIKEKKTALVEKIGKNESKGTETEEEKLFLELAEMNKKEKWLNSLDLS